MTDLQGATVPGQTTFGRRLRMFWWLLAGLNLVVLLMALPPFLRGQEELYQHQHARLVANAVSGLMLCAGFLARGTLRLGAMGAAIAALAVSVWLASGYAR